MIPAGWDAKSFQDVVGAWRGIASEVGALQNVMDGSGDVDADEVAASFARLERLAAFGGAAAEWCRP